LGIETRLSNIGARDQRDPSTRPRDDSIVKLCKCCGVPAHRLLARRRLPSLATVFGQENSSRKPVGRLTDRDAPLATEEPNIVQRWQSKAHLLPGLAAIDRLQQSPESDSRVRLGIAPGNPGDLVAGSSFLLPETNASQRRPHRNRDSTPALAAVFRRPHRAVIADRPTNFASNELHIV
jgi:hypothetical protein